ncbi:MAG: 2-phospho-L-lactate guanylyltransferase [Candidatus Limnocylindrales bacterium]
MPVSAVADLSNLHAIVPARGSGVGKSRLGEALDAEERLALVVGMLMRTLNVLAAWPGCSAIRVVTADPELRRVVRGSETSALAVTESEPGTGLNAALVDGRDGASIAGATAVLYLPADLPYLTTSALDGILEAADAALAAGSGRPLVVLAPADARVGTNALLLAPPTTIEPHFGESSLEAHVRAAAAADASLQLVDDPALGFDLDTPEDLERLEVPLLVELQRLGQDALDTLKDRVPSSEVA